MDSSDQNGSDKPTNDDATEGSEQKLLENDGDKEKEVNEKNESPEMDTKDGDKSSESPAEKDENLGGKPPSAYKNDMNVVLREDLKDVFQKFGTVKVSIYADLLFRFRIEASDMCSVRIILKTVVNTT